MSYLYCVLLYCILSINYSNILGPGFGFPSCKVINHKFSHLPDFYNNKKLDTYFLFCMASVYTFDLLGVSKLKSC